MSMHEPGTPVATRNPRRSRGIKPKPKEGFKIGCGKENMPSLRFGAFHRRW